MSQAFQNVRYVLSETDPRKLGDCAGEVAFVGRSNVGKSSLLNALCYQKPLARVSQTPGRTRAINVFAIGKDRWIIDLPGYGFAVGPEAERKKWRYMIEGYLEGRPALQMVFVLVDAEVGPTKLDAQMVEWLQEKALPHRIVANKADKVKSSRQLIRRREVAAVFGLEAENIAWVSSAKNTGVQELRREVTELLALG
jgi:GTP-binding protein